MTLIKNIKLGTPVTTGVKLLGTKENGVTGNFSIEDIKTYIESGVSLEYTLPESIGTAGQVLQVPAAGTELEWSDATITLTTLGTGGNATLTGGVLNVPQSLSSIDVDPTASTPYIDDDIIVIPDYLLDVSAGGSTTQMQYNNGGDLGGVASFTHNNSTNVLSFGSSSFNLNNSQFTMVSSDESAAGVYGNVVINGYSQILNIDNIEFSLRLNDGSNTVVFTNTSQCTLYVDADSITNFPIGTEVKVINYGSTSPTLIDCGAIATINGQNNTITETISQYETGVLKKIGTNKWVFGKIG